MHAAAARPVRRVAGLLPGDVEEVTVVTYVVWIAVGLAAVVFCIFAGWPLYNTYKTRGLGADVAEGQAYLSQGQGQGQG